MKAKFLFILLSVFFILPIDATTFRKIKDSVKFNLSLRLLRQTHALLEFNIAAIEEL